MPDFGSLWSRERPVAEALYKNHSDWIENRVGFLAEHYDREEAIDVFVADLDDFVQRLFDKDGRQISPVVKAALPVKWEADDRINFETIGWVLFDEYWPKGRKPKASKNRKSVGKARRRS